MSIRELSGKYQEYINSLDWYIKRKCAIERADYRCQVCGMFPRQGEVLEVHHKTYAHLGNEPLEDLQVVCHSCHSKKHSGKDSAQHRRMMSWAEHYLSGYENISEENIRRLYRAFVTKKIRGGK